MITAKEYVENVEQLRKTEHPFAGRYYITGYHQEVISILLPYSELSQEADGINAP